MAEARNVFGEPLAECCTKPMTGFYRDGSCNTGPEDFGMHTVCTKVDTCGTPRTSSSMPGAAVSM